MPDAATFLHIVAALPDTTEQPHSGRRAFCRRVIFATLAADGLSANLRFTPDSQQHWCGLLPAGLAPVAGAWGVRGWTTATLAALDATDLAVLLRHAWDQAGPVQPRR